MKEYIEKAFARCTKKLDEEVRNNFSSIYKKQGFRYGESGKFYERVARITNKNLGIKKINGERVRLYLQRLMREEAAAKKAALLPTSQ